MSTNHPGRRNSAPRPGAPVGNKNAAGIKKTGKNLNVKTEGDEKNMWIKAAQQEHGRTLSDWVRATLNAAAREQLGDKWQQ